MAFLEAILLLHLFLPLTYCMGHYKLEVFVHGFEISQLSCNQELMLKSITIETHFTSINNFICCNEPMNGTCSKFFQIGYDCNLNRTNPIIVNYTSEDDMISFAEIMFANNSSQEAYNITIDLMTPPLNEDYSRRRCYMDESGMFALHLSLKQSCLESVTGENCSIPGENSSTPGEICSTPGENCSTPGENCSTLGENSSAPGENCSTLGENSNTPGEICSTPGENSSTPGENCSTPEENSSAQESTVTPRSTPLSPTAVYLIASLGASIGFFTIIIIILVIAICYISKRNALKEDFSSKRQNGSFVNLNDAMSIGTDSLESQAPTYLTLINGQVHFADKERHKKEVIKIADIANSNDEGTQQVKAKSNIHEEHKPEILDRSEDKMNDIQTSQKLHNHNVEEAIDSASEGEGNKSTPNSSIASAEGAISTCAAGGPSATPERVEMGGSKRKSRLAQTESILYEEKFGDLEKSEVSQTSPTYVYSSDTNDNVCSEPLIQKSPSAIQNKENSLPIFVVSSSALPDGLQKKKQYSSPTKSKVRKEKRLSTKDASLVVFNIGAEPEDQHTMDNEPLPDVVEDPERTKHEARTTEILIQKVESSKFMKPSVVKSSVRRMEFQNGETESPKILEDFNLPSTSIAPCTMRSNPPSKLCRPCSSDFTKKKPKDSPLSQHASSEKGKIKSSHISVDWNTKKILPRKFKSMGNLRHKEECSERVSIPYISGKDHKKDNPSQDISKKRISCFEGDTPEFVVTPAGPSDVKSALVPNILIKEAHSLPDDISGVHAIKVSKKLSSDFYGELQKKLKERASLKVTPKSSSQDKPKSLRSEKITLFSSEKPDTRDSAMFSTPEPSETGTKQAKKPLMLTEKTKVWRASCSDLEKICIPVEVKPKKKFDESIDIAADGLVDVAGRRVGPVNLEDSAGYVPVDVPRRHSEGARIDLIRNSAYGIRNVAVGDSVKSVAAAQKLGDDASINLIPNLAYGSRNVSSAEGINSVSFEHDYEECDLHEYEYV